MICSTAGRGPGWWPDAAARDEPTLIDRRTNSDEPGEPAEETPAMLRIGIDEAGLGPLLGPLVVAGAAFRAAPDGAAAGTPADCLRRRLEDVVAPPGRGAKGRIVVGDSKQVFGPDHDLALLEVPVLAFAAAADARGSVPATLDDLLARVALRPGERLRTPWYAGPSPTLPLRADPSAVSGAAEALRSGLDLSGVEFLGFTADVVPESRLNAEFARRANKADVLFSASADVFDRLLGLRCPGEPVDASFDRQGGRRFYLPPVLARWPDRFAWAVEETPTRSTYRVRLPDAEAELRWVVGGDAEHLDVGLASMLAKYLREAFMEMWNRWFAARCPGVPGTAGYAQDGRRWLEASRAARLAVGVGDERVVRTR